MANKTCYNAESYTEIKYPHKECISKHLCKLEVQKTLNEYYLRNAIASIRFAKNVTISIIKDLYDSALWHVFEEFLRWFVPASISVWFITS
jgi:hypothetical protein